MDNKVKESSLLSLAMKIKVVRRFPMVQLVSIIALHYAEVHATDAADAIYRHTHCDRPSCLGLLTGTAAIVSRALNYGQLCISAPQAAAGILVPVLMVMGHRRSCLAFAFVAHVATTANHCIWAMLCGISLVAYPGNLLSILGIPVAIIVLALDLIGFVVLILGGDKEIYGSE